jgi:hypothetical protein
MSSITIFYQVCAFKNPGTGKYHLRKFIINQRNEFVSAKIYKLDRKKYKTFLNTKKNNEYKCYSVYDLTNISYPSVSDILVAQSHLLTTDNDYSGFAKF